ncbi:hypothetical protein JCM14036_31140 [Desulfotomaculum defluvii]
MSVWVKEFPVSVTVCDTNGKIIEMNDKSCKNFEKDGGMDLIGKNVLDCHASKSQEKLQLMLKNQTNNCYSIEKEGVKKLVYQSPWYKDGVYQGIVELIIELPNDIPHFIRK